MCLFTSNIYSISQYPISVLVPPLPYTRFSGHRAITEIDLAASPANRGRGWGKILPGHWAMGPWDLAEVLAYVNSG